MKAFGIWIALCIFLFNAVSAQILQQDFEDISSISELVGSSGAVSQLDALRATGSSDTAKWSIQTDLGNSFLQFTEDPVKFYLLGLWAKDCLPTTFVRFQADISLLQEYPLNPDRTPKNTYNNNEAGTLYFLADDPTEEPDHAIYPNSSYRLAVIDLLYSGADGIVLRNMAANGAQITTVPFSGSVAVSFLVNSGDVQQSYTGPNGQPATLGADQIDIWVNGLLVMDDAAIQNNTSQPIERLKFMSRNNATPGKIRFDNLLFEDLENAGTPLPVQWGSLQASLEQNRCRVTWQTLSEENNRYFAIERSADGLAFDSVGYRPGAGTSQNLNNYLFIDTLPLSLTYQQTLYYRIRQVDFDGRQDVSPLVTVWHDRYSGNAPFPNPCTNRLRIRPELEGDLQIELHDLQGRLVYTAEVFQPLQKQLVDIPIPESLPVAQYVLLIKAGQDELVYRIAKK